jgi:uncharacterized protein YndB with AHSA1/START domain
MLKKILIGVAVVLVAFVIIVMMQPSEFRVERSTTMSAPPSVVFEQVNDFRNWGAWSPWEKLDPAMKRTFDGASSGTGSIYAWVGNEDVGEGQMTITESRPAEFIRIKLEFFSPWAATSTTEFSFTPDGDRTMVRWSMFGENNFMAKAFGLFMDMDKLIGSDFEKGLAQLESVSERERSTE